MKKTLIGFEDIKAGDLLEVTIRESGVTSVVTGIAFEQEVLSIGQRETQVFWNTSEGGMIIAKGESVVLYRIDVLAEDD